MSRAHAKLFHHERVLRRVVVLAPLDQQKRSLGLSEQRVALGQKGCLGTKKRDHVRFRRLCIRSLSCLRSNILCCACSLRMILLGPDRLVLRR